MHVSRLFCPVGFGKRRGYGKQDERPKRVEIDTLAAAYADAGDFTSAMRYEGQAMKTPDANQVSSVLQQHLALFAHHRKISP